MKFSEYFKAEKPPKVERAVEKIARKIGDDKVSTKLADLVSYSHDYWPISLHWMLRGVLPALPGAVVWPESTDDVREIVRIAYEENVPLYPYGGGSGVLGGAIAEKGGIVVDLKRMRNFSLYEEDLMVYAEAGVNGNLLEMSLNRKGYSLGHIPQSIYTSTVGGWIATKATGQFSTGYGGVEDLVLGLVVVVPPGEIVRLEPYPRTATGPDIRRIFIGSEGTLGFITGAWLKIHPLPESRILMSYLSDSMGDALSAVQTLLRRGVKPAMIRIYDEVETKRYFYWVESAWGKIVTVLIVEGESRIAEATAAAVKEEFERAGSKPLGAKPVEHWLKTRFIVKEASEYGTVGFVFDTVEVAVKWSRALELYNKVIDAVRSVEGIITVSAHASHFYPQGVCFYFTFGGLPPKDKTPYEFYTEAWNAILETTLKVGGTISHHHGVGRHRIKWFAKEAGSSMKVLSKIKRAIDEKHLMNPGNLGL